MMKNILTSIVIALAIFAALIGITFGVYKIESAMDADAWNNGVCDCGGQYEFTNADHIKNGGNHYYYSCNTCGHVIELHYQRTIINHTYEVAAMVEEYDEAENCFVLVDWNGEAWNCEGDFVLGQLVIIELDDMGTASIYDDEILKIIF